jgi:S-formylglutathione hydrolase FrmB
VFDGLWNLRLIDGPVPIIAFAVSATLLIVVLARSRSRRWGVIAATAASSTALGWAICWLVSDVWNSFGVSLSVPTRVCFTAAITAVAVISVSIRRSGVGTKILAAAAIPLCVLTGGIGINADIGEFPVFSDVFGTAASRPIVLPSLMGLAPAEWVQPAGLPLHGRVGTVVIPAVVSHFAARKALVYLPPAALASDAPALPVLEMLSGQPGEPSNLVTSGQLPEILDGYARLHHGLAPIVVMPDQLGAPANNPMCVDSSLGDSATYLTVDVPQWIKTHLRVLAGPQSWAIGGSSTRYQSAAPLTLLAATAPYRDTLAIFAVGAADARFGPAAVTVARGATAAGMRVHSIVSPGTSHDWHTVQYSLRAALPLLGARWGLA